MALIFAFAAASDADYAGMLERRRFLRWPPPPRRRFFFFFPLSLLLLLLLSAPMSVAMPITPTQMIDA